MAVRSFETGKFGFYTDELEGDLTISGEDKSYALTFTGINRGSRKAIEPARTELAFRPQAQFTGYQQYVLVRPATPQDTVPEGDYAWRIFSVKSGQLLAKIPIEQITSPFSVIRTQLFCIVNEEQENTPENATAAGNEVRIFQPDGMTISRFLQAIDLETGAILWRHPIEPERILPMPM